MNSFFYFVWTWAKRDSVKSTTSKIKTSLISVSLGLFFGACVFWIMGLNPFKTFAQLFTFSFAISEKINDLFILTAIYSLSGLANAIAFRSGVFNIGVAGQMVAGGGTAVLLALTIFKNLNALIAIPLLIFVSIIIAGIVGLLVGYLKTNFNANEVVVTILLNWIIFYLFKFIFHNSHSFVASSINSETIKSDFSLSYFHTILWIIPVSIVSVLCIIFFCLFSFTTYGKKVKMFSLNKEGAKYAGIKTRKITIISLFLSGGMAGLVGFVYYFFKQESFVQLENTLPVYGFDGIAISLLAFNSPLAIPFISFIYAIFQTGVSGTDLPSQIQNETISLVFSLIIYFAAISNLFSLFQPWKFLHNYLKLKTSKKAQGIFKKCQIKVDAVTLQKEIIVKDLSQKISSLNARQKSFSVKLLAFKKEMNHWKKTYDRQIKSEWQFARIKALQEVDQVNWKRQTQNYQLTSLFFKRALKNNYEASNYELMLLNLKKMDTLNKKWNRLLDQNHDFTFRQRKYAKITWLEDKKKLKLEFKKSFFREKQKFRLDKQMKLKKWRKRKIQLNNQKITKKEFVKEITDLVKSRKGVKLC